MALWSAGILEGILRRGTRAGRICDVRCLRGLVLLSARRPESEEGNCREDQELLHRTSPNEDRRGLICTTSRSGFLPRDVELLQVRNQVLDALLVLEARVNHLGAGDLRLGVLDVF